MTLRASGAKSYSLSSWGTLCGKSRLHFVYSVWTTIIYHSYSWSDGDSISVRTFDDFGWSQARPS